MSHQRSTILPALGRVRFLVALIPVVMCFGGASPAMADPPFLPLGHQIGLGGARDRQVVTASHNGEVYAAVLRQRTDDSWPQLLVERYDRGLDAWRQVGEPLTLEVHVAGGDRPVPLALRSVGHQLHVMWCDRDSRGRLTAHVARLVQAGPGQLVRWETIGSQEVDAETTDGEFVELDGQAALAMTADDLMQYATIGAGDAQGLRPRDGEFGRGVVGFEGALYAPFRRVELAPREEDGQTVMRPASRVYVSRFVRRQGSTELQMQELGPLNAYGIAGWAAIAQGPRNGPPIVATVERNDITLYQLAPDGSRFVELTRIAVRGGIEDPRSLIVAGLDNAVDVGVRTADGVFRVYHVHGPRAHPVIDVDALPVGAADVRETVGPAGEGVLTFVPPNGPAMALSDAPPSGG